MTWNFSYSPVKLSRAQVLSPLEVNDNMPDVFMLLYYECFVAA